MKKRLAISIFILVIFSLLIFVNIRNEQTLLLNINSEKYNELIKNTENKLIYIGRPTCPECVEIQPILENIIEQFGVTVYYYNTDNAKEENINHFNNIKEEYNIQNVPVLISYDGSNEVDRFVYSEYKENNESLGAFIEKYRSKANK